MFNRLGSVLNKRIPTSLARSKCAFTVSHYRARIPTGLARSKCAFTHGRATLEAYPWFTLSSNSKTRRTDYTRHLARQCKPGVNAP
jgi:hypothetical protein